MATKTTDVQGLMKACQRGVVGKGPAIEAANNLLAECYGLLGRLAAENEALRKIISESATACGAAVSVECSIEFMSMLPAEIGSVVEGARKDAERYRWLRSRDLETISQGGVFAGITPQNMVLNEETLDQAVDAAMTTELMP